MTAAKRPAPLPDGIEAAQFRSRRRWLSRSALILATLGGIVAFGLSGAAGGQRVRQHHDADAVALTLHRPAVARSGDILFTEFRLHAKRRIDRLVVAVEPALWRDVTTNSLVPEPAEQEQAQGLHRFVFAALEAGDDFVWQVAQQADPGLFGIHRGRLVVFDDDAPLLQATLTLTVLP